MSNRLKCRISKGQFSDEYAVQGELYDSTNFSLFLPKGEVLCEKEPGIGEKVEGSITVKPLDSRDNLVLVELPQTTFENGRTITVTKDQLI